MNSLRRSSTPSPFVEVEADDQEMEQVQATQDIMSTPPSKKTSLPQSSAAPKKKPRIIFNETDYHSDAEDKDQHELRLNKTKKYWTMILDKIGTVEPSKIDRIMFVAASFDLVEQLDLDASLLWKYTPLAVVTLSTHVKNVAQSEYGKDPEQPTPSELLRICMAWSASRKLYDHLISTEAVKNVVDLLDSSVELDQIKQRQGYVSSVSTRTNTTPTMKEGTCTLSTTAIRTEDLAAVSGSENADPFDLLRATCGHTSGQPAQCTRNSCISARKGTTSHVCSFQTAPCPYQLSMLCYRSEDITNVPMNQRYLHSYMNITYHFKEDSITHGLLKQLMVAETQEALARGGHHFKSLN
jgi:hypothetical protein